MPWRGYKSAPCRLSIAVLQDKVLGPLSISPFSTSLYLPSTRSYLIFLPYTYASAWILACLTDISSWMADHYLKLNPSKTVLLHLPADTHPTTRSCHLPGEPYDTTDSEMDLV